MTKLLTTLAASAILLTGTAFAAESGKTVAQMASAAPAASASPAVKAKAKVKKAKPAAKKAAATAAPSPEATK